jgi:large subunit ribosomal protein L10
MISKQKKIDSVKKIEADLKKHSVVAIASNASLPARQYNAIKKKVVGKAEIAVARHTLLKRALETAKPEAKELEKYLCNGGMLVTSELNAFALYKLFKQNKSKAAAKPGAIAPTDLVVPAGETNLTPGPVLTELKQAKIDAKIQGPKVVISRDAVVAKKGEKISEPAAKILAKLGIEPFEIGIDVKAVWDHGVLYEGSVLDIDEDQVFANLVTGAKNALSLSVFAEIYNEQSAKFILMKAAREALALESKIKQKTGGAQKAEQSAPAAVEPAGEAPVVHEAPAQA